MTKTYVNYNNQGLLEPGKGYSFNEGVLSVKSNIVPFDKNQRQQAQALRSDFGLESIDPKKVTANGAEPTGMLKATEMQAAMAKNTPQESSGKKPGPGVQMPFTPPLVPTR
ncbi:MAG: hypothetical protein HON55_03640 [Legionellales bacterium]|nr:hypothetical protein [Legionellales bacterium]